MLFFGRLIMGYNDRNPTFSFRLTEYRNAKLKKLAKIENMTAVDFLRIKIIDKYFNGELIEKTKDDLTLEMEKWKLEKLKQDTRYVTLKNNFMENFGAPLPERSTRILKPQIITQTKPDAATVTFSSLDLEREKTDPVSPYDEKNNRLACLECNQLFTWKNQQEFNDQLLEFQRHMTNKHEREINHFERAAIIDVKFLGASR